MAKQNSWERKCSTRLGWMVLRGNKCFYLTEYEIVQATFCTRQSKDHAS
jgi:hypothetical protein